MLKNFISNIKSLFLFNNIKYVHHTTHSIGRVRDDLTNIALKVNDLERILIAQQITISNQNKAINGYQLLYDNISEKLQRLQLEIEPDRLEAKAEKLIAEVIDKMDQAYALERKTITRAKA